MIELDVDARSLRVDIDAAELERRIAQLPEPEPGGESGWAGCMSTGCYRLTAVSTWTSSSVRGDVSRDE